MENKKLNQKKNINNKQQQKTEKNYAIICKYQIFFKTPDLCQY